MPIYGNNAAKLTKILATIFYTIDEYHPDILLYEDKNPNTIQTFSDVYRIDKSRFYGLDDMYAYIKHDLALVAGGGYSSAHIHNVRFEFETLAR